MLSTILRAAEGDVLYNAHHVRQGRGSRPRGHSGDLFVPGVQDRAARPDLRVLRPAQNEIAAGTMGVGGGWPHHGRRVTNLPAFFYYYYFFWCVYMLILLHSGFVKAHKKLCRGQSLPANAGVCAWDTHLRKRGICGLDGGMAAWGVRTREYEAAWTYDLFFVYL